MSQAETLAVVNRYQDTEGPAWRKQIRRAFGMLDAALAAGGAALSTVGSASDTALKTVTIPAETLGANDHLEVEALYSTLATANSKVAEIKIGSTVLSTYTIGATIQSFKLKQRISNRGAVNSQVFGQTNPAVELDPSTSAVNTSAIDFGAAASLTFRATTSKEGSNSVTALSRDGDGTASATSASHGYSIGEWVEISGANEGAYNGVFQITDVPDGNTFEFALAGGPDSATGTIIAERFTPITLEQFSVKVVRG